MVLHYLSLQIQCLNKLGKLEAAPRRPSVWKLPCGWSLQHKHWFDFSEIPVHQDPLWLPGVCFLYTFSENKLILNILRFWTLIQMNDSHSRSEIILKTGQVLMVSYYMVLFKYIVFIGLILGNMQAFLMYLILNIFSILLLILLDQCICKSILL